MHLHQRVIAALSALMVLVVPANAEDHTVSQMVAAQFARTARALVASDPMTLGSMEMSFAITQEALALDPDNTDHWRWLLDLATLADREELKSRALERLRVLDPDDDVVRLKCVNEVIDEFQTFEERVAAYERFLTPANRKKIGAEVCSRLAYDLALLFRRHGDIQAFADWLAEAVVLDPAYPAAAAEAAGYYRSNVADAYGQAELLKTVVLANPADAEVQASLAQLLLENGAYSGAERIYSLSVSTQRADKRQPPSDLLADLAIAQWGTGDIDAALRTLQERQRQADMEFRTQIRNNYELLAELAATDPAIRETVVGWWKSAVLDRDGNLIKEEVVSRLQKKRGLTTAELSQFHGTVSPGLAFVRAAIHAATGSQWAEPTLARTIHAYEISIRSLLAQPEYDARTLARFHLGVAWASIWLGSDPQAAAEHLLAAERAAPLSEVTADRFSGWIALREGSLEEAESLLGRHAETDPASNLGMAHLRLEQGRRSEAARCFLKVARDARGTLIGVWAADRLASLLGRHYQVIDDASRLDKLIASIPRVVDGIAEDGSLALRVEIVPKSARMRAYDPFQVELRITNVSPIPLALTRGGPLAPNLLILPKVKVAGSEPADPRAMLDRLGWPEAIVIDIGRRLRLDPREELVIPLDLTTRRLGGRLGLYPLEGTLVSLRVVTNIQALASAALAELAPRPEDIYVQFTPGALGVATESSLLRVDGVTVTPEWVDASVAAIAEPDCLEDLRLMALLSRWLATGWAPQVPPDLREKMNEAAAAMADAFPKLTPTEQVWLLCVMPHASSRMPAEYSSTRPLQEMALQSENRLVQLAHIWYHTEGPNDPSLEVALQSEHESVVRAAQFIRGSGQQQGGSSSQPGARSGTGQGR